MRSFPLIAGVVAVVFGCNRSQPAPPVDTLGVTPIEGSIPLVSPGSVPLQSDPAGPVVERELPIVTDAADTTPGPMASDPAPPVVTIPPAPISPSRPDSIDPDSIIGRDSAFIGPLRPVPVPPDTGQ